MSTRLALIRKIAANALTRSALNVVYNFLPWSAKQKFWCCSKVFRWQESYSLESGNWQVRVKERLVTFPLDAESMWLDWDNAVSFLGHDAEIKYCYERLIESNLKPAQFIDVGANFGLDSLFFLIHGIRAISIEPNVRCHDYFKRLSALNNCQCEIVPISLADDQRTVELTFPEKDTWLGTTDSKLSTQWNEKDLIRVTVQQSTLDQLCTTYDLSPDLIKIDTEGAELAVLRGGQKTLRQTQPIVIFESWKGIQRAKLFEFFKAIGYEIIELSLQREPSRHTLDNYTFNESCGINFLAFPSVKAEQVRRALLN